MLVYPGAWTMTNGPRHWEMLLKARANDCQVYVAGACGARDENAHFVAWGHSTIVDPWCVRPPACALRLAVVCCDQEPPFQPTVFAPMHAT